MPSALLPVTGVKSPEGQKLEKEFDQSSILKKLIRMFRTSSVTKHHFQGNFASQPKGTAKAFFRNQYSFQSSTIPGYSAYDRFARYSDYAEMESYSTLHTALNIFADEVTQKNEDGKIIEVISEDKDIEKLLSELFESVLHLSGKNIWKLVRNLCKYGDVFYLIDITPENGVVSLIHMPANEVEREEGFDRDEPGAIRFRWTTRNNLEIPNAYIAHFRLDGNDLFWPYGQSAVEGARRPWRQLVILEDSVMVYRITRAPERRVFFLDMLGIPPEDVETTVNKFNQQIKKNRITNDKGQMDLRYAATMSVEEDYVIPIRGGDSGTRIETLPGGQNIGDIEDIEMIRQNLFSALGIPKAYLTFDQDVAAKQTLTQEDIRFARTVSRIQEVVISELVKIAMIHLYVSGYRGDDLVNFRVKMTNPSTVSELQKNELWRARMDLVHSAGEGIFDSEFIYKNFLKLSDDTINAVKKGQILDKIFQSKLIRLEGAAGLNPSDLGLGGGMGMGMGGGMGMPPMPSPMGMDTGLGGGGMGGTPQLGMSPPGFGMGGMGESKDLWKSEFERAKETRGVAEIPGIEDDQLFDDDPADIQGIKRTISRPLGVRETRNALIEIKQILNEFAAVRKIYDKKEGLSPRQVGLNEEMFSNHLDRFSSNTNTIKVLTEEDIEISVELNELENKWEDELNKENSTKILTESSDE